MASLAKKTSKRLRSKCADKNNVAVTEKIFAILRCLVEEGPRQEPVTFQRISAVLPFAKTTLHRLLYSMQKLGFVEKAETKGQYRLGPEFFKLTGPAVHFRRLVSLTRVVMLDLLIRFSETVNLSVVEEGQAVFIEVLESPSALRTAGRVGDRNTLHSTAVGKAILAFLPEKEVETILEQSPLIKMTPRTITQKAHLMEHLASVREQGVALDLEENLSGATCVGAPIFDDHGRVVGALSISGPTSRMEAKLTQLQDEVRNAGNKISRMLGARPKINPQAGSPGYLPPNEGLEVVRTVAGKL